MIIIDKTKKITDNINNFIDNKSQKLSEEINIFVDKSKRVSKKINNFIDNKSRKISRDIDNFIDNIFIDIASNMTGFFKKLNFTPNHLTTIGNIFGIFCIKNLISENYVYAALYYFFRYLFDCLDGYYSRKYRLESTLGDNYDHYSDYIFFAITTYILFKNVNFVNNNIFYIIYIFLSITASLHLSCTEYFFKTNKNVNSHLSKLKIICPNKNLIHIVKYVGCGSLILFVIISLLFYTK